MINVGNNFNYFSKGCVNLGLRFYKDYKNLNVVLVLRFYKDKKNLKC